VTSDTIHRMNVPHETSAMPASIDIAVTEDQANRWRGAPNQQEFCDKTFGLCRQDPNYWAKLDLIEDALLEITEAVVLPFPSPAEL